MNDMPKDITAEIDPEAAVPGLLGRRAVVRIFEYLRTNASRLCFFSALHVLSDTPAERQMSREGINRAISGDCDVNVSARIRSASSTTRSI